MTFAWGDRKMRNLQQGVSLGGLLIVLVIVLMLALVGLKLAPSYMEFSKAKSAIEIIARDKQTASVADIRKAFDARASIDDIETVKGADLEVTKEGSEVVVSFSYRKEIPLVANLGVYIDFAARSKP